MPCLRDFDTHRRWGSRLGYRCASAQRGRPGFSHYAACARAIKES